MTSNPTTVAPPVTAPGVSADAAAHRDRYWRSLSELHQSDEFVNGFLHREFPVAASELPEGVSRRRWLQIMGASLSVAGAVGCRYPTEVIAPFVIRPEGRIPGEQYSRSTNFELAGRVYNLLVTNVDGRPIKIEGNPNHPTSRGGTDAYVQASILGLYDPDRARGEGGAVFSRDGKGKASATTWEAFDSFASSLIRGAQTDGGRSFAVLASRTHSPSVVRMLQTLRERLPEMTLCRFDGVAGDVMATATQQAIGTPSRQVLDLDQAKVVFALQSDFLGQDVGFVRNANRFYQTRDPDQEMSRLYVAEGGYTNTGTAADSRLALRPSQMAAFLSELERRLDRLIAGETHDHADDPTPFDELLPADKMERFIDVLSHDLHQAGSEAVVLVGEALGPEAIAAGIRINGKLGSLGSIQRFLPLVDADLTDAVSIAELRSAIAGGKIESLLILGENPAFTAPAELRLADAIANVENSIYLGEYDDETAARCRWSLPMAHPLESWGDCLSDDGIYGVCQPQILPLLGGRTVVELLAVMLGEQEVDGESIVRRTADEMAGQSLSERQWRALLHDGFAEGLEIELPEVSYVGEAAAPSDPAPVVTADVDQDDIDVLFVPADGVYDGRFANNGWLQELPQSLTKLTWDNAAIMSPRTARALRVKDSSMVVLRRGDAALELPVYEMPGCAPGVVTVAIGYGRTRAGMVGGMEGQGGEVVGFDVSPIRTADALMWAPAVEARPLYRDHLLATTQDHWAIDELGQQETVRRSFGLVREGTVALLEKNEHFTHDKGPHVPKVGAEGSLWREPIAKIRENQPELPQWGMSVDLTKCMGCNACVVACQSENNVPIVGKTQVATSREMHWLRIDRYFQGGEEDANVVTQPVACMHCETAPCEQVCPVAATVHTNEGINAMAYNRCIGTRYCANNCPYKVRRFNYFNYNEEVGVGYGVYSFPGTIEKANRKLQALVLNPDVTVRGRGVMEKCTFCVQRVEAAKINARRDGGRPVRDGEVKTACQMACPSGAIEFGNIHDENAIVTKKHGDRRAYGMLSQLNVKPRTLYLSRIRNTHPRLMTSTQLADLQTYGTPSHHGHGDDDHAADHGHADGDHDTH